MQKRESKGGRSPHQGLEKSTTLLQGASGYQHGYWSPDDYPLS